MFFLQLYGKALFAGFLNGLYIGRKLREKKKCFHFTNMQILKAKKNLEKSNKIL